MAILYSNVDAIAPTRVVIEEQTVAAAMFSTVTIPAGYRTIEFVLSGLRSPDSAYYDKIRMSLNGNTTDADYLGIMVSGYWYTAGATSQNVAASEYNSRPDKILPAATGRATDEGGTLLVRLADYDQTTYYKTIYSSYHGQFQFSPALTYYRTIYELSNVFPSTAAITSAAFSLDSGQTTLTTGRLQVVGYK